MGQVLGADRNGGLQRNSNTQIQLNLSSFYSDILATVGGQQYQSTGALLLNTGTGGVGGLDTGSLSGTQLWYIYAVLNGSSLALVASLSPTSPSGFAQYSQLPNQMLVVGGVVSMITSSTLSLMNVQVSSYVAQSYDSTILFNLSGAATVTLPSAIGLMGKVLNIGTISSGQILTINTVSGQSVGPNSSGQVKMASAGDSISLQSDNANWKIVQMNISVVCHYVGGTSVSLASGGTLATFQNMQTDTLGSYNPGTGLFTAPFAGRYYGSFQVFSVNATSPNNISLIGGTLNSRAEPQAPSAGQATWIGNGATFLSAGGTIQVNNGATAGATTYASGIDNWLMITRIGN